MANTQENRENSTDFILGSSKITADGDCRHGISRCLLLGRKAMTNVISILKSKDITLLTKVVIVQSLSHVQLFVTLWTTAHQASLFFTISWSLPKLLSIESVMPSYHLNEQQTTTIIFALPKLLYSVVIFHSDSEYRM